MNYPESEHADTDLVRLDRRELVSPPAESERERAIREDAQWRAIEARLTGSSREAGSSREKAGSSRSGGKRAVGAFALVAAAALALVAVLATRGEGKAPIWAGTTLVAGGTATAVSLEDGSEIVAAPGARLERLVSEPEEERVALRDGSATFEVARNPQRTFVVEAADVEVRVVGTRFVVRRELGGVVEVRVERGAVDVVAAGEVRRLRPGQSWRGEGTVARNEPEPSSSPAEEITPEPPAPERRSRARQAERRDPREAFDEAREARREGQPRRAAELYERFVDEFPRDERAGLAAFELGRVRMDALRDPRGAIEAFQRALELAPRSPFAEDARARLVSAHAQAGDEAGCERARARYLARHPEGRHVASMRDACP